MAIKSKEKKVSGDEIKPSMSGGGSNPPKKPKTGGKDEGKSSGPGPQWGVPKKGGESNPPKKPKPSGKDERMSPKGSEKHNPSKMINKKK